MGCNPCCCWSIRDGVVTIGIWSAVYAFASLVLFGWQFAVLNNCRTVTMAQANLQCEYYCPCVGSSTARTSGLIEGTKVFGVTQLVIFGWQSYAIKWEKDRAASYQIPAHQTYGSVGGSTFYENFYETPTTRFYTVQIIIIKKWLQIFCLIQFGIFGWQMAAIKYEKDRAGDTVLPNYYEYGKFDVPSYYESYWQSPEERFYTALFVIQILCLIVAFFLLFASLALVYGAHTASFMHSLKFSRYLIYPWFPCMIASVLCSLTYCIIWWTGDVRDYWLVLTILEMISVFINVYCLAVVIMFSRQLSATRDYYAEKERIEKFDSFPDRYDSFRKNNYNQFNRLSELDYPIKPGKNYGPPSQRDEYNRLPDRAPDYYDHPPIQPVPYQQRPSHFDEPAQPSSPYRKRFDFEKHDDMVSNWVREQQLIGFEDHANSEPASPTKEPYPLLQHSRSVPSMYAESSGATTCRHHCHKFHHSHRHKSRDRDRRGSSHRHSSRHRHRSASVGSRSRRSYSSTSSSSGFTEEPRHRRHRSHSRHRYSDDATDVTDDSRDGHRKHHRRSDRDRDHDRRGPRRVKRNDKERGSKSSLNVALTQDVPPSPAATTAEQNAEWQIGCPQGGITIPQHIIIPPSTGTLGPNDRLQPQTYQINSEIRILYDQQGRPLGPETAVLNQGSIPQPQPQPQLRSSSANSSNLTGKQRTQPISITSIV